eukprot:gene22486-biopygen20739
MARAWRRHGGMARAWPVTPGPWRNPGALGETAADAPRVPHGKIEETDVSWARPRPFLPGVTGHWRGRGAGYRQLLAWVARAWRGHGAGVALGLSSGPGASLTRTSLCVSLEGRSPIFPARRRDASGVLWAVAGQHHPKPRPDPPSVWRDPVVLGCPTAAARLQRHPRQRGTDGAAAVRQLSHPHAGTFGVCQPRRDPRRSPGSPRARFRQRACLTDPRRHRGNRTLAWAWRAIYLSKPPPPPPL